MSNPGGIVAFPNKSAIEAEASAWIAKLDAGALSDEERSALQEWQSRSALHRETLAELGGLWSDLDDLKELAALAEPVPIPPRARWRSPLSNPAGRYVAAAAAVILLIAAGLAVGLLPGASGSGRYETAVGEQKAIALPDGSTVTLNTNSRLDLQFSAGRRDLTLLRGEAYFEVAHDKRRPFTVAAGENLVRAVGTAFDVRLQDGAVQVTVTKGNVELAALAPQEPQAGLSASGRAERRLGMLAAGQNAVLARKVNSLSFVTDASLDRQLSWRRGVLVYAGEPLAQVVADISRYTAVKIEFSDRQLESLRVSGYFKPGDTDALFEALEQNFGVRADRIGGSRVRLSLAAPVRPDAPNAPQ